MLTFGEKVEVTNGPEFAEALEGELFILLRCYREFYLDWGLVAFIGEVRPRVRRAARRILAEQKALSERRGHVRAG